MSIKDAPGAGPASDAAQGVGSPSYIAAMWEVLSRPGEQSAAAARRALADAERSCPSQGHASAPQADAQAQAGRLAAGLVDLLARLYAGAPSVDAEATDLIEQALAAGRGSWAAAARAVWAMALLRDDAEDAAIVQLVRAELDLREEQARGLVGVDPPGGPTGPAAAANNLGTTYSALRLYELAEPHLLDAVRLSRADYGPQVARQILIDQANLAEVELRWALYAEGVERVHEARQRGSRASMYAQALVGQAAAVDWPQLHLFASVLAIGGRTLVDPESITRHDLARVQGAIDAGLLGGDFAGLVGLVVLARVSRMLGDHQGAVRIAEQTTQLGLSHEPELVAAAWREAALDLSPLDPGRRHARVLTAQLEQARRRSVTGFRARLLMAGLEQRNEELAAAQEKLQRELDEAAREEAALVHAATHDHLTGLPNRALLAQRLESALAHGLRDGLLTALAFVDLDDFKAINDAHGHDAGDRVLRWTAERLANAVRPQDTVARLAGDEFVAVLHEPVDESQVLDWAERLNDDLNALDAQTSRPHEITASVGVCVVPPLAGVGVSDVLALADRAMYQAKRQGKASVVVLSYDPDRLPPGAEGDGPVRPPAG